MPDQNQRPFPPHRRRRRRRRINPNFIIFCMAVLLAVVLLVLSVMALVMSLSGDDEKPKATDATIQTTEPTDGTAEPAIPTTEPSASTTEPSAPPVAPTDPTQTTEPSASTTAPTTAPSEPIAPGITLIGNATIGATGDILMHKPCIRPGEQSDGTYDFSAYFAHIQAYINATDYAVANLETTLAGLDLGYEYSGYPQFNCPDGIVPSLQGAGFDMLLTANNHTYDTSSVGFHRTMQVMKEYGMDFTGTFASREEDNYLVREIDGIRIGMICYTYEDAADAATVAPNGHVMTKEDAQLINTFHKKDVAGFRTSLSADIANMEADGAEAIVLFIHWGDEYALTQNADQEALAQTACDLGVDVIVGGHAHVIQPMDLLTSTTDSDHKTVCLYSTGNAISNQRQGLISSITTAHTEDGILFSFTFAKYSDGTVRVESVEALPTWVNLYTSTETWKKVYDIIPLDKSTADWKTAFGLTDDTLSQAEASYDRTMAIIGDGLAEVNAYLASLPEV
ncbi:MAG: CapA family protein [Oscillospiraceae bacterium]|nr:CapA family protein [Oscillospiraceae bacterium]